MSFKSFINQSYLLLEGGAAIKNTVGVPQAVAIKILPSLTALIAKKLKLDSSKVQAIGSAGNKPADQLSGDLDIAIETTDLDAVKQLASDLGHQGQSKAMPGINVYSFAYAHKDSIYQVDLMPVESLKFATWSFYADKSDLAQGLKSAHRNELLFALAHYVNMKVLEKNDDGEVVKRSRYIFDLSKGLFTAVQSRAGKKSKLLKGFSTIERKFLTNDPDVVIKTLLGNGFKSSRMHSFNNLYEAIMSSKSLSPELRGDILKKTVDGLTKKKLKIPDELSNL